MGSGDGLRGGGGGLSGSSISSSTSSLICIGGRGGGLGEGDTTGMQTPEEEAAVGVETGNGGG